MEWSRNPGSSAFSDYQDLPEPHLSSGSSPGGKEGYQPRFLSYVGECEIEMDELKWNYYVMEGGYVATTDTTCNYDDIYSITFEKDNQQTEFAMEGLMMVPEAVLRKLKDPLAELKVLATVPVASDSEGCQTVADSVKDFILAKSESNARTFSDFIKVFCSFYRESIFEKVNRSDMIDITKLTI
ncbi:hypothetical protein FOL47_001353 [Perkinsus chesapeaki]|uniref:Uncharacterized protein n=1 Tax=Perkinsus chesapeaki TaxID=330153 RepID=A0A7J6MJM3_PERCH|nr:hypothetical protein FOL47_001353 [Perkinsus chesapeaki]